MARDKVPGAQQDGLNGAGHVVQALVAHQVAITVVLAFEVIDVHHRQRQRGRIARRTAPLGRQPLIEPAWQ